MAKRNEEQKGTTFNKKFLTILLAFSLFPACLAVLLAVLIAGSKINSSLETQEKQKLRIAAESLASYYEWGIFNSGEPTYEHDYVDNLKNEEIELTVFKEDTRLITSILNDDGSRNEGTKASKEVWEAVKSGKDFFSDDITISGNKYYVYYVPIYSDEAMTKVWGMAFAGTPKNNVTGHILAIVASVCITAVVCLLVLAVIIVWVANKIRKPMIHAVDAVEGISKGDISTEFNVSSSIYELNQIMLGVGNLQKHLSEAIGGVKNTSNELSENVMIVKELAENSNVETSQISLAVNELAIGAQSMAESVQDLNTMVGEMGNSLDDITASVSMLSTSSESIQGLNDDASKYMNEVEKSSENSVSASKKVSEQITITNDAIQNIGQAVDLILNIASQTQLLALNASIEAARAGELGKGFAVVANEISTLAEQSSDGANQIREIADKMTEMSDETVEQVNNIVELINEEQKSIVQTKKKFNLLSENVKQSIVEIHTIKEKVTNLDKVKDNILASVSDLSAISEENAASNQEVTASIENIAGATNETKEQSDNMAEISKNLVELVDYFK